MLAAKNLCCYTFLLLLSTCSFLYSQDARQETVPRGHREVSIGVGVSTGSFALAIRQARKGGMLPELYDSDLITLHSTPALTVDYQQPVGDILSIGAAASMQSYRTAYEFYIQTT